MWIKERCRCLATLFFFLNTYSTVEHVASAELERRTLGVILIAFDAASIRNVAMKFARIVLNSVAQVAVGGRQHHWCCENSQIGSRVLYSEVGN